MGHARIANRKMRLRRAIRSACCNSVTVLDFCGANAQRAGIYDKMRLNHAARSGVADKARMRLDALGFFAPLIAFSLDRIEQLLAQPN